MGKIISGIVFVSLLTKLLGFFKELLLSYYFGATGLSDAYLISQTIPGTIFQFVGTGLTTCYIPVYFHVLKEHGFVAGNRFTRKLITMVLFFSTLIIGFVWLFTSEVIGLFASGFTGSTLQYTIAFTRINICNLYFSAFLYVYNSFLQANKRLFVVALASVPSNVFIILSIVLGAKCNIWLLSIGSALAPIVQLLFLYPAVHKLRFRFHLDFKWRSAYMKEFFKLMIPTILGVSVSEINTLIDRMVASQVAIGGISALSYANSLIMLVQGGFVQQITTAFYPRMAKSATEKRYERTKQDFNHVFQLLIILLLPTTVGFILLATPIITVLFGRGVFNDESIRMTAEALSYYALGLPFIGIRELLSRYYYALGNTRIPMQNAIIGLVSNIILNLTLSRFIGIGGLALATSISAFITVVLMWIQLNKMPGHFEIHIRWVEVWKVVFATVCMGFVILLSLRMINEVSIIQLGSITLIGMVSYYIAVSFLRVEGVKNITDKLRRAFGK